MIRHATKKKCEGQGEARFFYLCCLFICLFSVPGIRAQINAYGKITALGSGNTVLSLSNLNQTFASFAAGEKIIVVQMQGATISGSNNNSSFGTLASLNAAGLYEVAEILAINGSATSMTLTSALVNSYNVADGLQVVSFPQLGVASFTTAANITGVSWNGNRGGVIAFYVNGNLTLNHNISANGIGFRGGNKAGEDGGGCENNVWRIATGNDRYADKGEGIYITTSSQKSGKAKAVNGGGAAIVHNGGGGGGGNYTSGGDGYYGYTGFGYCSALNSAGGQGGLAVSSNGSRVFMGGGGGGGQENNNSGTNGGDGGGLIFISCDTLVVDGACSPRAITANGASVGNSGNDGCGGGGAGGSIVMDIDGIRVKSGCTLTISANGGAGGSVNDGASHGAGGGGGQGAIYIRANGPFANTSLQSNNGAGGSANNGGSAPVAGSGGGSNGAGVNSGVVVMALPVELLSFTGTGISSNRVKLSWETASEKNNRYFEILHSSNGGDWNLVGSMQGAETSQVLHHYEYIHDRASEGINYYRLRQVDEDGSQRTSPMVYVHIDNSERRLQVYPNPNTGSFILFEPDYFLPGSLRIFSALGIEIPFESRAESANRIRIDLGNAPDGVYIIFCGNTSQRIIVNRGL